MTQIDGGFARELRECIGLNQEAAGELIHRSRYSIMRWEAATAPRSYVEALIEAAPRIAAESAAYEAAILAEMLEKARKVLGD